MRWLECAHYDLENGAGGVEVHSRSLARELRIQGIEVEFSRSWRDLERGEFDVIHTHGSSFPLLERGLFRQSARRAIRLHTLHGETLGRMAACGEWTWIGGYVAAAREIAAVRACDGVIAVREALGLSQLACRFGKPHRVIRNGWDSFTQAEPLPRELETELRKRSPFWLYVGRGEDPVKGADAHVELIRQLPDRHWVVVPGSGFEALGSTGSGDSATLSLVRTGRLSSNQVRSVMALAAGLVVPSRYEGAQLAVLEALSAGIPVVATRVGEIPALERQPGLAGWIFGVDPAPAPEVPSRLREAVLRCEQDQTRASRPNPSEALPRWREIARQTLDFVSELGRKLEK